MRGFVSVGDLLKALDVIGATTSAERIEVARLLGFEASLTPAVEASPISSVSKIKDLASHAPKTPASVPTESRQEIPPPKRRSPTVPLRVETFSAIARHSAVISEAALGSDDREVGREGEFPGSSSLLLLKEREAKALISELVASNVGAPPVDIEALAVAVARGEAVKELPFGKRRTLAKGCDVLIDLSAGLQLLADDRDQILRTLRLLMSPAYLEIMVFHENPEWMFSLEGERVGGRSWRWAVPGRPVLILSDFGVAGSHRMELRRHEDAWNALLKRLRDQRRPVVGLIPFPRSRWPRRLTRWITLIKWDRSMESGQISRARFIGS